MTNIKSTSQSTSPNLLNPTFDKFFIQWIALGAIASAMLVAAQPKLFNAVLLLDVWLLGYHHVISTYTRTIFDEQTRTQHRKMLLWAPIVTVVFVVALSQGIGLWTLTSVYFYWQWWHYTRQSWGVSRVYERKAGLAEPSENPMMAKFVFYLFPAWGILWRSAQQHETFLGTEFKSVPVPEIAAHSVGIIACAGVIWLAFKRYQAWRRGEASPLHTLYLASHFMVFGFGYLLIGNVTIGWLAINIWHNAQYIAFVWYFNNRRFTKNSDASLLSRLSQTSKKWQYFGLCLAASSIIYFTLSQTLALLIPPIVMYQIINFHHYIVDSYIWKVRQKPMQKTLGLVEQK